MAYISHEYRLAFFAAPATGSTAVISALKEAGIGELWPAKPIERDGERVVPAKHSTLDQLRAEGLAEPIEGYFKCVGVRNVFPWHVAKYLRNRTSRLRNVNNPNSWIHTLPEPQRQRYIANLQRQAEMSFSEFLHSRLDRQEPFDPQEDFRSDIDLFLHQEALAADFETVKARLGLPAGIALHPANVTGAMKSDESYRDYYDDVLIARVYEMHHPFFERFPEYSFDGLDPARSEARASFGA